MLTIPFNPFVFLKISPHDGYEIYHNWNDDINIELCKLIYIDPDGRVYKVGDKDVYYASYKCNTHILYHTSISKKQMKQICEDYSHKSHFYYIHHKEDGKSSYGKKISCNYNLLPEREQFLDKLVEKMTIHKNLTINILLHGEPGTGKSTFVECIADKMNRNVEVLPVGNELHLSNILTKLSSAKKSIILMPEIDKILDNEGNPTHSENDIYEFLDGSNRPHGSVIIITCNDLSKLKKNKVLSRPGRIHFEFEFTNAQQSDIEYIVKIYFPDFTNFSVFNKYIGKVSHAEFHTAVCQAYIMDKNIEAIDIKIRSRTNHSMFG